MNTVYRRLGAASFLVVVSVGALSLPRSVDAQASPSARSTLITRPTGWLGVHYSAEARIDNTGEGLFISYNSYPVVEAVEPGSPAEKSGIQVGDTLLAFNGHDFVRRGVPMARLLRPGEKLTVRVKRNARRNVVVTVAQRPPGPFAFRMTMPSRSGGLMTPAPTRPGIAEMERSVAELREANVVLAPRAAALAEDVARKTVRALERDVVMHPSVAPLIAFGTPSGAMGIAGAEMVPVNPELGGVLGVRRGVLVVNVPAATPADRSGLRGGDVIVRAGSDEIVDPAALHMAMVHVGPVKALQLDLVRKGRPLKLTLHW